MRNDWKGRNEMENRMVVDAQWTEYEREEDEKLPICDCCEEKIRQFRALHILSGKKKVWLCDRCIEVLKEVTGW